MGIFKRIVECFKPRYVWRDAETGAFVTKAYAKANPKTTVRDLLK